MKSCDSGLDIKSKSMTSSVLSLFSVVLGIVPFVLVVLMIGDLAAGVFGLKHLLIYSSGILTCLVLKSLFYGLSIWKAHDSAYKVLSDIRIDITEHLKKLPLSFYQSRKTGDLIKIISHDVEQVELYLAHALPEIVSTVFVPAVILVVIFFIDWRLAVSLFSTVPLLFFSRSILNKLWGKSFRKFSESTKKMSEDMVEYIATIPVIKAFSREENKTENLLGGMNDYISWVKKVLGSISVPLGVISLMLDAGLVFMIIAGSLLYTRGDVNIQQFVLSLILGGFFSSSFARLATFQHFGIVFNQSKENINSILCVECPGKTEYFNEAAPGDIEIRNLNFSYPGKKKILDNIDLVFREKSVNAIVGKSGSGKTTLAQLIMGFWLPDSGSVSIGNRDIAQISEKALSELLSIVQQDVVLFNQSIEENIRIGRQDATLEEVEEAAKKAGIHDFITDLPEGYKTLTGELGARLSGGEKQRISIARMILKNSPIIILDEATSAIDPANEYLIQKAIENLGREKTVIMIAHNLNTVIDADQIVVMDEGRISASGKHDELMDVSLLYREMVEQQDLVDNWQIREDER